VDCTLDRRLLDGYLDGELGFERVLEVEAHLASCRNCSMEVQQWKEVRGVIQRSDFYYRAPEALEEKVRKLAGRERRDERSAGFLRWLWAGGGAAFATAALLLAFAVSRPAEHTLQQDLVASHIRSLMADHLIDVVSTDQHTVKPWFNGKLEFSPPVQDLAAEGYPLAGGRLDYLNNHAVAVLIYHRALHVINLYVWPAGNSGNRPSTRQAVQGYNIVSWKKDGFEFRAVSDLNAAELQDFARLVSP
jgi:anti-sigma factor RsiW